jgi:RNA-binding motif X-linked protein 2
MNQIREIENLNRQELERGLAGTSASWHSQYAKSPWVFVGNLDHELTEGKVKGTVSPFDIFPKL